MRVPFVDLSASTKRIKKKYLEAAGKFLDRGQFILSGEIEEFEKAWAKKLGVKHCVGVGSGADALHLSLLALGIGEGDEVIIQGNAYNASVVAVLRAGAVPRFADIDEQTLTIDISKIEPLVTEKTKAILPVHLYGQPNNMVEISRIAKRHNLFVVEDAAQAHLAKFAEKYAGTWGKLGCFSFYPTKNLGAFGEGGCVVTDDARIAKELRARRHLGQIKRDHHVYFGYNSRLQGLQAIALSLKLEFLERETKKRKAAAAYYGKLIYESGLPVQPQAKLRKADHVYHLYPVQVFDFDRDELKRKLLEQGVETGIYYPVPVYKQPFYTASKGRLQDKCEVTEQVARRLICLPLYPEIARGAQDYVIRSLEKILQ